MWIHENVYVEKKNTYLSVYLSIYLFICLSIYIIYIIYFEKVMSSKVLPFAQFVSLSCFLSACCNVRIYSLYISYIDFSL